MRVTTRRAALAAVAGALALGLGTANAARLDVRSASVAAGTGQVGDCQGTTPLRAELASAWGAGAFTTTGVVVHGVAAACVGLRMDVTLVDGAGHDIASVALPVVTAAGTQPRLDVPAIPTADVADVRVILHS